MYIWVILVLSVIGLLLVYLGWRLVAPLPVNRAYRLFLWLVLAAMLSGYPTSWFFRRSGGEFQCALCDASYWLGFIGLGFVSILVVLMFVRDLPCLIAAVMSGMKKLLVKRSRRPYFIGPDLARRRFLLNATNGALVASVLPLTGYGMFNARRTPVVLANTLSVPGLPAGLDGFTVAQISDTHIGPTLRASWAGKVTDTVNGLGPDMIVHTGDMVDGSVDRLKKDILPFRALSAPHGVWFCTGNHEYYSGVHEWLAEARRLGMTPLVNEHRLIDTGRGRILLGGVSDIHSRRLEPAHVSSPVAAMRGAPPFDVSILLAHHPASVYAAAKAGFDIQLSGHTHGGQYFPYNFAVHLFHQYVRGLYLHENTVLYVNTGTGYWGPPIRLGTVPEITLHTLRPSG